MTTTAMVVAMVPLLIAKGAGAASRFDIGLVIASGMTIGTIFTLFVTPAVYTFLAKDHQKARARAAEQAAPSAPEAAPAAAGAEMPAKAAAEPAQAEAVAKLCGRNASRRRALGRSPGLQLGRGSHNRAEQGPQGRRKPPKPEAAQPGGR